MDHQVGTGLDIDVDIAFTGFPIDEYLGPLDACETSLLTQSEPWCANLKRWLEIVLEDQSSPFSKMLLKTNSFSIGLNLTNDLTICELNKCWMGKNSHTDVLSFPIVDDNTFLLCQETIELGDIVVSVPTAQRQAQIHNHGLRKELRWLVSHGLLHILGWDHPSPSRLKDMLTYQELLLNASVNL